MCQKIHDGSLDAPLLAEARGESTMASLRSRCNSVAGILMVTLAAILFGVVAAFVKATALPTLLMLQIRAILEWVLGITVSILYHSNDQQQRKLQILPLPQPEAGLVHQRVHQRFGPKESPALSRFANEPSESTRSSLFLLLFGPLELRGWLALRAFLYWAFLAAWWLALSSMPIGDATTIVYCGPIFTALFARLFLGERIDWSFYPVVILDAIGLILITRPSFLFERDVTETSEQSGDTAETAYLLGAASALFSAIVAGLLPVCTRISKQCFWTAVNHVSSALSAVVFTPLAFGIWFCVDANAADQLSEGWRMLTTPVEDEPLIEGFGRMYCILGATFTGFAGLALQTLGYQREEASRASVMTIIEIPFAYLLQAALFHEPVTPLGLLGVGFVCSGTMLNLLRQMQRKGA